MAMENLINLNELFNKMPWWDGMNVADFGSGSGIFTIEMAKRLNPGSNILAIDILEKPLMFLIENAKRNGVANLITTKVCDLENKTLGASFQESIDVVTVINVLFQIKNKENLIKEARRILKPSGFLIIVDWESYKIPLNDKLYPVKQDDLIKAIESFGFALKEKIKLSHTHFGIIFIKQ